MSHAGKAAVITTVDQDDPTDLRSLRSVIECSGSTLGQFIVVVDALPDRDLAEFLDPLTRADSRVKLIWNFRKLGKVESYNRGLAERGDDAVILRSDTLVTPGWLEELAAVAHSEARTACAAPLTNDGGICSVPELHGRTPASQIEPDTVITGCSGLPRWTVIPKPNTTCIYLRGDILDAVGLLDPTFQSVSISLDDWVLRAETLGFIAKRANHAFVQQLGMVARSLEQTGSLHQDWGLINERYPHSKGQHARFCSTLDAPLAAHAARLESTGKLKVVLDIRHLPNEKVGTRTYAVCLAKALAELGEIDLSLLVRDPNQAKGLRGHVVTEESWRDDPAVIHRPAQILHPQEMKTPVRVQRPRRDYVSGPDRIPYTFVLSQRPRAQPVPCDEQPVATGSSANHRILGMRQSRDYRRVRHPPVRDRRRTSWGRSRIIRPPRAGRQFASQENEDSSPILLQRGD